jgi:predicted Zn-dependent protease
MPFEMDGSRAALLDEVLTEELEEAYINDTRASAAAAENGSDGQLLLAMVLARSCNVAYRLEAADILSRLVALPLYSRRNDASFCLSQTLYTLGRYDEARFLCEELMRERPDDTQTQRLHEAIAYKQAKQRYSEDMQQAGWVTIGLGLAASVLVFALAAGSGRRK